MSVLRCVTKLSRKLSFFRCDIRGSRDRLTSSENGLLCLDGEGDGSSFTSNQRGKCNNHGNAFILKKNVMETM